MKKKIAILSAAAVLALASCNNTSVPSAADYSSSEASQSEDETSETENSEKKTETSESPEKDTKTSEEPEKETDKAGAASEEKETSSTKKKDTEETTKSQKKTNQYNTYSMEELYSKGSPLLGYWHTENKDMYIEYNQFGGEGFTIFILGADFQIFSSEIGTFTGTPQNTEYILASSEEDEDVTNLYNKGTKLNLAVNDDNTISVFLDYGYAKTSTYTFSKSHPDAETVMTYIGDWGEPAGIDISFTYEEGKDMVDFQTLFGFSSEFYPVGIISVTDDNECWLCCPYKKGMLTTFSDQGVFYDVINVHMHLNTDGTLNVEREYTNPTLRGDGFINSGSVLRKFA